VIGPVARVRLGLRAALRRRYGYAALRVLRTSMGKAVEDDLRRSVGTRVYRSVRDELGSVYWRALAKLRKRWPALDLEDPRAR
jgi:hypothetical protein